LSVTPLDARGNAFEVKTTRGIYRSRSVLLAIGRRGTPRKLNVAGEELSKVVYKLSDAEQYRGQRVAVVGGGDSAIEAAVSLAEQPGTAVTIIHRGDAFVRCKPQNRERINELSRSGQIESLLGSAIATISDGMITVNQDSYALDIKNDAVIICAGGIVPSGFLKSIGIDIETKYGTA
jgi:thioredoxin reductase (NADPH)